MKRQAHTDGKKATLSLVLTVLIVFVTVAVASIFGSPGGERWYRQPAWAPPDWLFGPVWTVLYLSMAVSAWLVWMRAGWRNARQALLLFAVQLLLNAVWTPVFFGLRRPGAAFAVIVLMWAAIAATVWAFRRHSTVAAVLLLPYLLWVAFAAALNWSIWRLTGA